MEQFLELYELVYKDLYRLAYYYLGNVQDAEDVVGETILKAYENFERLQKKESFRAWIFKILVNQCRTYLRKKTLKGTIELAEEPSFEPKLEDGIIAESLLSMLSSEERQIVALSVFGGYKGKEIARLLHMRHNTVRTKYRRALKKLEKYLQSK